MNPLAWGIFYTCSWFLDRKSKTYAPTWLDDSATPLVTVATSEMNEATAPATAPALFNNLSNAYQTQCHEIL